MCLFHNSFREIYVKYLFLGRVTPTTAKKQAAKRRLSAIEKITEDDKENILEVISETEEIHTKIENGNETNNNIKTNERAEISKDGTTDQVSPSSILSSDQDKENANQNVNNATPKRTKNVTSKTPKSNKKNINITEEVIQENLNESVNLRLHISDDEVIEVTPKNVSSPSKENQSSPKSKKTDRKIVSTSSNVDVNDEEMHQEQKKNSPKKSTRKSISSSSDVDANEKETPQEQKRSSPKTRSTKKSISSSSDVDDDKKETTKEVEKEHLKLDPVQTPSPKTKKCENKSPAKVQVAVLTSPKSVTKVLKEEHSPAKKDLCIDLTKEISSISNSPSTQMALEENIVKPKSPEKKSKTTSSVLPSKSVEIVKEIDNLIISIETKQNSPPTADKKTDIIASLLDEAKKEIDIEESHTEVECVKVTQDLEEDKKDEGIMKCESPRKETVMHNFEENSEKINDSTSEILNTSSKSSSLTLEKSQEVASPNGDKNSNLNTSGIAVCVNSAQKKRTKKASLNTSQIMDGVEKQSSNMLG